MDLLTQHLRAMLGPGATFREGQRDAIEAVIEDGHRALVVQRTGWGKSLVYWIATRVRRDEGRGPTLIISPLLALMRNQIAMAGRLGLRAATIDSGNTDEWDAVHEGLAADAIDVLLISPERLANERFMTEVLPRIQGSIGPCSSSTKPTASPTGAMTSGRTTGVSVASSSSWIRACRSSRRRRRQTTGWSPMSPNSWAKAPPCCAGRWLATRCSSDAIVLENQAERLAWLAERIPQMPGSGGIVYCLTVADTQRVATFLRAQGIDAHAYNADLSTEEREVLEDALVANEMKALVATVALGMGFDKPDLGFVVHYQRPARPSRTTSRLVEPVGPWTMPTASCSPVGKTTRSPSSSWTPRFRRRPTCTRSSTRSSTLIRCQ